MTIKTSWHIKIIGLIVTICIIVDQASKSLAFYYLTPPFKYLSNGTYSLPIINNYFDLTCSLNTGIAFGMGQNLNIFFTIFTTIIIFSMGYFYKQFAVDNISTYGFSLIFGGAIGNLIDRIFYNAVRDFIDIHYYNHHWPIFNIADSCISIGVGLIIMSSFVQNKQ